MEDLSRNFFMQQLIKVLVILNDLLFHSFLADRTVVKLCDRETILKEREQKQKVNNIKSK